MDLLLCLHFKCPLLGDLIVNNRTLCSIYSVETGKVSSACLCKFDVILCKRNNFHGQKLGNLSQASHNKTKKYFKAICQRLFEVKITFDSN